MKILTKKIYKELLLHNNVLLVGRTNSGKTYYAINELLPFLKNKKINPVYFKNCDIISAISNDVSVVVIDEVEILADKDFLEQRHHSNKPYYSPIYLEKVKKWQEKLKTIKMPAVFILTRNEKEEINNLVGSIKITDWGTPVKCLIFEDYVKLA